MCAIRNLKTACDICLCDSCEKRKKCKSCKCMTCIYLTHSKEDFDRTVLECKKYRSSAVRG